MRYFALVCVLFALHCVVLFQQILSNRLEQWVPRKRQNYSSSRGIRPAAPKCLAIAIVDDPITEDELHRLPLVLSWCAAD